MRCSAGWNSTDSNLIRYSGRKFLGLPSLKEKPFPSEVVKYKGKLKINIGPVGGATVSAGKNSLGQGEDEYMGEDKDISIRWGTCNLFTAGMRLRQASIGNSLGTWDSAWFELYTYPSSNDADAQSREQGDTSPLSGSTSRSNFPARQVPATFDARHTFNMVKT